MNDEVLYENKTIPRKSIIENGIKIYYKKNVTLRIAIVLIDFYNFVLGCNFWFKKNYIQLFYCLFFCFCILFVHKITYLIMKKKQKYSFDLERTYRFYDDRLEVTTEISKLIITYDKIKMAFENNKEFYMVFERSLLCIDKNNFVIGNNESFEKFIKNKVKFK